MTPEQLRASILQQAMEGKLVKQDPNDEPASILLEKITKEKARLIKEKKIKRTKKLPEITDDEKPFDIPGSWEWVRLGEIGAITSGGTPKTTEKSYWEKAKIPWITPAVMSSQINGIVFQNTEIKYINKNGLEHSSAQLIPAYSIVVSSRAPIGYVNIVPYEYTTNQGCKSVTTFSNVNKEFIYYTIKYSVPDMYKRASGTTFKEISGTKFGQTIIPLPPLAEQKRIVAKIDQIMPLVDEYAEAYDKLKKLDDGFNDKLKQSLLQYAMEGKLVKQDPNDEPASVLLEKIAEEKARLIKEKKIKRTKKLPEITDDEKPFKIPDSWEWVRLGDLSTVLNGDRGKNYPGKRYWINDGVPFVNAGALGSKLINKAALNYISDERFKLLRAGFIKQNDLLYCLRGSLGKIAISNINKGAIASSLAIIRCFDKNMVTYLFWLLKSPISKQYIKKYENGTAQPNLSAKSIEKFEVPLPPLAEQKRIVAKIDQLMATIH